MSKHLFLLRHAESGEKSFGQTDKERELTTNGIREARLIGDFLLKGGYNFDLIVSSTANRASSTIQIVANAMRSGSEKIAFEDNLYEASLRTFMEYINQLDDGKNQVMCVGHNPTISYLSEYITNATISDMAPGGLVIIKLNLPSWKEVTKGCGEFVHYIYPSMLETN
jgi:phosphohistidine phosphatase